MESQHRKAEDAVDSLWGGEELNILGLPPAGRFS
jgi:hypothetical protein